MSEENQKLDMIAGEGLTVTEDIHMVVESDIIAEVEKIAKDAGESGKKGKTKEEVKDVPRQKTGRPTKFKKEMIADAEKLASIFCPSKEDLASYWGVGVASINRWIQKNPEFRKALEQGKSKSKRKLTETLYNLAIGGNLQALIFTLTNKFGDEWTDRKAVINNTVTAGVQITENQPSDVRKHVDSLGQADRKTLVSIISRVEKEVQKEKAESEEQKTDG